MQVKHSWRTSSLQFMAYKKTLYLSTTEWSQVCPNIYKISVCISTINCKSQMVKVNDSMRTGDVPSSTKELIATILNCSTCIVYLACRIVYLPNYITTIPLPTDFFLYSFCLTLTPYFLFNTYCGLSTYIYPHSILFWPYSGTSNNGHSQ